MKIIVVSDTHGSSYALKRVMELNRNADIVVHCGDSQGEMEDIKLRYPDKHYVMVKGNCDLGAMLPLTEEFTAEGVRFFVCHGHTYNVKWGLLNLYEAARERKADVALFGHTHMAHDELIDGIRLFNPGSAGYDKSFGVIEVKDGQVLSNIAHIT